MRRVILTIGLAILFFCNIVLGAENWDIYSNTDISEGTYNLINIYDTPPDNTTVNMFGGSADFITTYNESTLNFYDGYSDIQTVNWSVCNIYGGEIGFITASDNSTLNFYNSYDATSLVAEDFSIIYVQGGYIGNLHAHQSGVIYLYGGAIPGHEGATGTITADDSSIVNIYGYDLFKTSSGGFYGNGQVYGFLMDDTYISVDLYNSEAYEHINLIPEPATLSLFSLAGLIFVCKQNRRK